MARISVLCFKCRAQVKRSGHYRRTAAPGRPTMRNHGTGVGVEAQIMCEGELVNGRRFTLRELATRWAEQERQAIERGFTDWHSGSRSRPPSSRSSVRREGSPASDQRSTIIADGTGTTPRGGQVGIMVWGRPDAITGLEVYAPGCWRRRPCVTRANFRDSLVRFGRSRMRPESLDTAREVPA